MNDCFVELPSLKLPLTLEDLFVDEDYLLFSNSYVPGKMNYHAGNIHWFDGNLAERPPGDNFSIKFEKFSGHGVISNKNIQRRLLEFAKDTLPPDFIKLWELSPGIKTFPCNIIAWCQDSNWHCEGIRYNWQKNHELFKRRGSTVLNFRLLGEEKTSKILYGKPSNVLHDKIEEMSKHYNTPTTDLAQTTNGNNDIKRVSRSLSDGLMVNFESDSIHPSIENHWNNELTIIETKVGFENPFMMNLAQWHKVCIGPNKNHRVTLRFMANNAYPFSFWEKMIDSDKFFI